MELSETHTLPVSQQRAWEALNDTDILHACIPGCETIEADGEHAYNVVLSASVGPVKARFKGRMQLTDIEAPNTYTIVFEGQGGAAGFGKGTTRVTLAPEGDEATRLEYTASAQVGGKLAQIGSRLVDGAARKLAGEFFKRLGVQLGGDAGATAAPAVSEPAADETMPQNSESHEAADSESGGDAPKRKKSWTAWISKS
ncbi:carbon monoxide dehydrogenase subunit G [Paraburkholderia terricola]|uniref:CoxG family protein n=1 Tax=Paraburkholderia terricola TaxID=169427 RepID=UPI000DEF7726|nr:carbon monoxide dehydrogenase subunit G [Paraburkholderia terricola]AXE91019.1 carbon monoxide dehydrogenase [Paraburkholderia terricola]MDR6449910.1 carbon monoxide dehydrogenase subunit G [Paraburkholderia terricola]MDR6496215.1 carbon monoxide dehydrogenase subunit G [Paraburkholderia terricola]